jgi:hypothetical protein
MFEAFARARHLLTSDAHVGPIEIAAEVNMRCRDAGLVLSFSLLLAACSGLIKDPGHGGGPDGGSGGDSGSGGVDGGPGSGNDGGTDAGSLPFTPDPPAVYLAKVKNILVGLPVTDTELDAGRSGDPAQLAALVDGWMQMPEYYTKMLRFFELSFQQTQITEKDFTDQIFPARIDSNAVTQPLMLQNLEESFARTMVYIADAGTPFNQAMSTQTFMMTTALKSFYGFMDDFQVGNQVGCGLGGGNDTFKKNNPNLKIYITASQIPLSQTVDAGSANYMHWYDPDLADAGCSADPMIISASAPGLYELLQGDLRSATNGGCTSFGKMVNGPLQPGDFQDWRMTTITQPTPSQTTTPFWDLPTLRTTNSLVLSVPRVGFFTTPAFFANWQTNASNQMRVTMNQTFIVSTGAQVDGTDTTTPPSTPGLDSAHAAPGSACFYCHQILDPSRSIFAATYSWDYGLQPDPTYSNQPGLFAFEGVIQPAMHTIYDLGTTLAGHPLLASGWAQKLCYYVNSEPCAESDVEFQNIVSLFQTSNYSWNQLVKAVVISPITTHAASTTTATTNGEVVAVSRRDHLCAALDARLGLADVCGLNATVKPIMPNTAYAIVSGLPSDAYSRGSVAPVLPTQPTLFLRGGLENFCESLSALLIDNSKAPPGAKTWSSANSTQAIADFVAIVIGIPASDPRNAGLQQLLNAHFTAAKQVSGVSATSALQSTFTAACMSPSAVSIGL